MTQAKASKSTDFIPSVFTDFFDNANLLNQNWFDNEFKKNLPAVNVRENPNEFNIELAAPGFKKGDFRISVEGDVMTIAAEKEIEETEKNERFTRKEFSYHSFSRAFTLPHTVDGDRINATYMDGILKLQVPKKEEAKANPRKEIKIN